MRRLPRIARTVGVTGVVIALVAWGGFRLYLQSGHARGMAAAQLTDMLGLPVEVESLSVGTVTSSVRFRVVAPPADGGAPIEIARVAEATADISIADVIARRATPSEITLRGLELTLLIDRDGRLLTRLPQALGSTTAAAFAVRVQESRLTIHQEGRPDFILGGVGLHVSLSAGRYTVVGDIHDAAWGPWDVHGDFDRASGAGTLILTTADGSLVPDLLRSIPYVTPATWEAVVPNGKSAARVTLSLKDGGPVRYDVELKPAAAALTLPDLNVALTNVIGTIHIHDARVDLTDCQATLADGTITVNGELDFKPQPDILKFNVHASNVDVRRLPAEWSLPHGIEGRLRGRADVTLKVFEKGRVETQGTGRGTVVGAKLGGVPAEITLNLHTESNRLLFHSE